MKPIISFKMLSLLLATTSLVTLVQATHAADEDYQEVTYDELLNELNQKKKNLRQDSAPSPFDSVQIHIGLGYVNSFSNFRVNNETLNRYQNGLQLSLGIDLFSPEWYAEGVFRNYGVTSQKTEEVQLREFDLKLGYKNNMNQRWSYNMSTGLANRFLKISDSSRDIAVSDTTPSLMISGGVSTRLNKSLSLGAELNARTPFVSNTADKDSVDFALKLTTSL